jgi:predicted peroxiredoxin
MKFLYLGSHGPEDPTRASLPLHMAKGAVEAGHTAEVVLQGDAALLFNETKLLAEKMAEADRIVG